MKLHYICFLLLYRGLMMDLLNLKHVAKVNSKRIYVLL
jgi:hypothetical protein